MKHTRWLALLLVGVGPLIAAGTTHAQKRSAPPQEKSYIEFKPEGDLSQILNDKLLAMRGQLEFEKIRANFGDKVAFPPFDPKGLANPALQKRIQNLLSMAKRDPNRLK